MVKEKSTFCGILTGWSKGLSYPPDTVKLLNYFSGEMLVVLGRPGSGCSTLLKTISGETDGFFVDPTSEINYQGK